MEDLEDLGATLLDTYDDPDPLGLEVSFGQRLRAIFLPENRLDRSLTSVATALVVAISFQYLLFPGFGIAKRVLPLLVPAPISQAFEYLVPDDIKQTISTVVPGADRISEIIIGRELPDRPEQPDIVTAPPTTLPAPVVPVINLTPSGSSLDISIPASDPLAPGDRFQRAATMTVDGAGATWDVTARPSTTATSTFSSQLRLTVEFCDVPWSQASVSPPRFSCSNPSSISPIVTSFNNQPFTLATNLSSSNPLYPRFYVSWDPTATSSDATANQSANLKIDFTAVPH